MIMKAIENVINDSVWGPTTFRWPFTYEDVVGGSLSSVKAINFAFYNKFRILLYQPRSEAALDLSVDTYL